MSSSSSNSENLPRATEKELDAIRKTLNPPRSHRVAADAPIRPAELPINFMRKYNNGGISEMIKLYVNLRNSETAYQRRTRGNTLWRGILDLEPHEIIAIDQLAFADSSLETALARDESMDGNLKYLLSFPKNRSRMFAFMIALYFCSWKKNITLATALEEYRKLCARERSEVMKQARKQNRDHSPSSGRQADILYNHQVEELNRLRAENSRLEAEIFTLKNHQVAVAARTPRKVRRQ